MHFKTKAYLDLVFKSGTCCRTAIALQTKCLKIFKIFNLQQLFGCFLCLHSSFLVHLFQHSSYPSQLPPHLESPRWSQHTNGLIFLIVTATAELLKRLYFPNQIKHSIKIDAVLFLYQALSIKSACMVLLCCAPNHLPQACKSVILLSSSESCALHMADKALCSTHGKSGHPRASLRVLGKRSSFPAVRKDRTYLENRSPFWHSIMFKKIKSPQKLNVLAHLRSSGGRICQVANQSCTG